VAKPSKTSLFAAAKRWDALTVAAMLKEAPELLEVRDERGRTVLHIACGVKPGGKGLGETDGTKTVAAILKAGAPLESIAFREGEWLANPVWYAVGRGENPKLAAWLLKRGGDPDQSLWAAAFRDDAESMKVLIAAKPNLNRVIEGESPIFWAARLQRLKCLDLLIKAGADPMVKDAKGRTAIEIAKARKLPKAFITRLEALAGQ
jgi:uncharacterized protein